MTTLSTLSAAETLDRVDDVRAVYRAAFRVGPDAPDDVDDVLTAHAARPDFRCVFADDGSPVGFGYGFTGGPGQPWRDDMAAAVGAELTTEWLHGHFEFAEFAVVPSRHRDGIGSRIHQALFDGLAHERSVLTVNEQNSPAIAFYERHGWEVLHAGFVASAGHGPYLIMGRRL